MRKPDQELENSPSDSVFPVKRVNMGATLAICSGGWLLPGLSHVLLGKWVRGLIFFACVLTMFVVGIAMSGKLYDLAFEAPLQIFAFLANVGVGVPYLISQRMGWGIGTMEARSFDYGTMYL